MIDDLDLIELLEDICKRSHRESHNLDTNEYLSSMKSMRDIVKVVSKQNKIEQDDEVNEI